MGHRTFSGVYLFEESNILGTYIYSGKGFAEYACGSMFPWAFLVPAQDKSTVFMQLGPWKRTGSKKMKGLSSSLPSMTHSHQFTATTLDLSLRLTLTLCVYVYVCGGGASVSKELSLVLRPMTSLKRLLDAKSTLTTSSPN